MSFGAYSLHSEFLVVSDKVFVLPVGKTGLSERQQKRVEGIYAKSSWDLDLVFYIKHNSISHKL
jgi:hypothetical protein